MNPIVLFFIHLAVTTVQWLWEVLVWIFITLAVIVAGFYGLLWLAGYITGAPL